MKNALWEPSLDRIKQSNLSHWMKSLKQSHGLDIKDYKELHRWSVENPSSFWEDRNHHRVLTTSTSQLPFYCIYQKNNVKPKTAEYSTDEPVHHSHWH